MFDAQLRTKLRNQEELIRLYEATLRTIIDARDAIADGGDLADVCERTTDYEEHYDSFDDWAADVAELSLAGICHFSVLVISQISTPMRSASTFGAWRTSSMAAKDRIQVVMDPETRDIIDRIPRQERSRFVRVCIQHAQATGRRVCGLAGAPAGKVHEVSP